jgi:DNA invertase Pin-like site-specific DNA recombinase
MSRKKILAVGYMRTSSATNVGVDKDSEKRLRAAIEAFAKRAGYLIADDDWFYDTDVKGSDLVTGRNAFKAMLDRIQGNGVRVIIVEDASRLHATSSYTGHDYLKGLGVTLIAANAPEHFPGAVAAGG